MHSRHAHVRPVRRQPSGRGGFTLVELLAACVVMATVFLSGLSAMRAGFELLDTARNSTLASQIMQSELEDIRLLNWASLPASGPVTLPANVAGSGIPFSATRTVADVADHGGTMKSVTIVVNWTSHTGRNHTRTYETRLSKNGINDYFVTSRD